MLIRAQSHFPTSIAFSGAPQLTPPSSTRLWAILTMVVLLCGLLVAPIGAREARSFADMSIEELMNESVTSVSKREQKLFDVAAAITVLTNDDLRRSGATSIAEALRLVPGMDVGSVNASSWAISARGFNGLFSNKLPVLVDGRAVYTPTFSGVFWDLQQTMLEDVDRVEVIRGPGATVWGANAVNGVINVVTRSARETQGGLVYGGGGNVQQAIGGWRYGGQLGPNTYYRVLGSYLSNDSYPLANGQSAHDDWQGWHGGVRLDHYLHEGTQFTWQAEMTATDYDDHTADSYNANTLGRWTRQLSDRSSIEVQAYYDRTYRNKPVATRITSDIVDFTAQHTFGFGPRNDVIWGAGYRFSSDRMEQTNPAIAVRNHVVDLRLFSAFVQDEFKLVPDKVTVTAGLKIEHNDFTGFEFQPGFRAVFKPTERQTLWAAVSRSVRTPNASEGKDVFVFALGAPFPGPGGGLYLPAAVGNGNPDSEILWAYELGYRIRPADRVSVDLATFYNDYRDLLGSGTVARFVPGVPFGTAEIPSLNILSGHTYGGEAVVTVSATDSWRLTASYSLLRAHIQEPPIPNPASSEKSSPRSQAVLRSSYDFTKRMSLDAQLRQVGAIQSVPAYTTADLRFSFRPTGLCEVSLVGQNLLDRQHPEQPAQFTTVTSEALRSFYGKITWRF